MKPLKTLGFGLSLAALLGGPVVRAQNGPKIKHVLVISIDGMRSADLANWVQANPHSTLARLTATGVNYPNAFTTQPSDSIPSTVGIFTGASPSLGGMYYDDAWHRVWAPSKNSKVVCTPGVANGTAIDLKQGIDFIGTALNTSINPDNLPRDPFNNCAPVYPHNMMRVNTIFEVARAAGLYTAYSEKRPSYDFLNGPSGAGVQDLYTPEINAVSLLNLDQIIGFDQLRVNSILNEINEMTHDGSAEAPKPALFGMNFQSVNSAKKASTSSGYLDSSGNLPDPLLQKALIYVDTAIGSMTVALAAQGMAKSTVIIVTAKHGESPAGNTRTIVCTDVIQGILTGSIPSIPQNKVTQKTTAFVWLKNHAQTNAAVAALNSTSAQVTSMCEPSPPQPLTNPLVPNLGQVLSFGHFGWPFPDPGVGVDQDPATPDIVVVMKDNVNFEPSPTSTYAEHGGFNEAEMHVPLLVSRSTWAPVTQFAPVLTRQIAPTVLALLGLDPNSLHAVHVEHTPPLQDVVAKLP